MSTLDDIKARAETNSILGKTASQDEAKDTLKLVAALEAVEKLHYVAEDYNFSLCNECRDAYPCPTLTAISEALR